MNKLYILGALALANVEAYINWGTGITAFIVPNAAVGSYTYTIATDCYSSGTVTSLGMNNIYHQYYAFVLTKGSNAFASVSITVGTAISILIGSTAVYTGCHHSHLYNWLAQPAISTTTAVAGFGNSAVAYGYAMTGTTVTACANQAIIGTSIFKTGTTAFLAGQFGSATSIYSQGVANGIVASTIILPIWGRVGPHYYYAKVATGTTFIMVINTGFATITAQNAYWDFMQTTVIQGMTQFGRGGGASTAPCGWWTVYAYENPKAGQTADVDAINVVLEDSTINIHMWTDNSVVKAASAFVLAALAGLLF